MDKILLNQKVGKWNEACRFLKGKQEELSVEEWTAIEQLADFWRIRAFDEDLIADAEDLIATLTSSDKLHSNNKDIITWSKEFRGIAKLMYTKDKETFKQFQAALREFAQANRPQPSRPAAANRQPATTPVNPILLKQHVQKWLDAYTFLGSVVDELSKDEIDAINMLKEIFVNPWVDNTASTCEVCVSVLVDGDKLHSNNKDIIVHSKEFRGISKQYATKDKQTFLAFQQGLNQLLGQRNAQRTANATAAPRQTPRPTTTSQPPRPTAPQQSRPVSQQSRPAPRQTAATQSSRPVAQQTTRQNVSSQQTRSNSNPQSVRNNNTDTREPKRKGSSAWWLWLLLILGGGAWGAYNFWYKDYKKDKDALKTYVYATNLFLRSSMVAEVDTNLIDKVPYGSEIITYSNDGQWAYVKAKGKKGYVASDYLMTSEDFQLLDAIWGDEASKELVSTSKYRLAMLDYVKSHNMQTGVNGWQLFADPKDVKCNPVLHPLIYDGCGKPQKFAFILTDNKEGKKKLALYAFNDNDTPVFRHEEDAPADKGVQWVRYVKRSKTYKVAYGAGYTPKPKQETTAPNSTTLPESATTTVPAQEPASETPMTVKPAEERKTSTVMPEFYGGMDALTAYLTKEITPDIAKKKGLKGRVVVNFVVEKDGSITGVKVNNSVHPDLDKEAIRVVRGMPKWLPGSIDGLPVKVEYAIPITFQ